MYLVVRKPKMKNLVHLTFFKYQKITTTFLYYIHLIPKQSRDLCFSPISIHQNPRPQRRPQSKIRSFNYYSR
jgi:hypothetical protein